MSGLECCEVMLSDSSVDNEKSRLDSDFFQKKYLQAYKKIKSVAHTTIENELEVLTDFHSNGSYESIASVFELLDTPDYAYMVRTTDLEKRDFQNDVKYISKEAYDFLAKSKVYGGEVIINKIGCPGMTFLMPALNRPVSLGMNQFMLRLGANSKIGNQLLYVFLNSNIGKLLIERKINGTVPLTIDKQAIRSIYIPYFSQEFRLSIERIIALSDKQFDQAIVLYTMANNCLINALNLDDFTPSKDNTSITTFSQVIKSERLDAEYYQKKYDDLFAAIHYAAQNPNVAKVTSLEGVVSIKKSIEPGSDEYCKEGIPFLRVSDISKFEINLPDIFLDRKNFDIDGLKPKKDTILFSKDGSVGIAYKANKDMDAITSSALLHLTITDEMINPDYLTLLLNSFVVGMQAERDVGGSILKHWRVDEIKKVQLPILQESVQQKIAEKVRCSFALREQSKALLKAATRAVEIAIEENETAAMDFLREREKLAGICRN